MNKQELFKEIDRHLMEDKKPSDYFNRILEDGVLDKYPLTMLKDLINTDQPFDHHPEGSVWNHTMLVVDKAAEVKNKSEDSRAFMWAALLHDLGKAPTTKVRKGRITSYDHDKEGEKLAVNFLREFTEDENFIYKVSKLVRWHMQILFVVKGLPFADIENLMKDTSAEEIALLGLCDRLGRGGMNEKWEEDEKKSIEIFLKKCKEYMTQKNKPAE